MERGRQQNKRTRDRLSGVCEMASSESIGDAIEGSTFVLAEQVPILMKVKGALLLRQRLALAALRCPFR